MHEDGGVTQHRALAFDFVGRPDTHSGGVPVGLLEDVRLRNVEMHPVLFDFL